MHCRLAFPGLVVTALLGTAPVLAQEAGGISSTAISRCAGKVGMETRQHDQAFGVIMIDGMPWVTIERTEEKMGTQMIATTVTGTGARRRRDGTTVPFRFTCLLDQRGQALMFHASQVMPAMGDALPPATIVAGSASYRERMALPPGAELRVQLLDIARSPTGDILAEQVVRSGWQVPIPFALRLPKDTLLEGRKLAVTARLVAARRTLFQLKEPRTIAGDDFRKPFELTLDKAEAGKR
jgi:uncharacterized lipoprotein YbaY